MNSFRLKLEQHFQACTYGPTLGSSTVSQPVSVGSSTSYLLLVSAHQTSRTRLRHFLCSGQPLIVVACTSLDNWVLEPYSWKNLRRCMAVWYKYCDYDVQISIIAHELFRPKKIKVVMRTRRCTKQNDLCITSGFTVEIPQNSIDWAFPNINSSSFYALFLSCTELLFRPGWFSRCHLYSACYGRQFSLRA
jgi:hypothetical protein